VWLIVWLAYLGRPRICLWTRLPLVVPPQQIGPLDNAELARDDERKDA
jgi:hypothetical protein